MFNLSLGFGFMIIGIAFLAEYVDSSLGMGYGTTLTPLLLLLGFEPLQIVPAILLSELVSGLMAGLIHHSLGNVDFGLPKIKLTHLPKKLKGLGLIKSFQRGFPLHLRIALLLALCSIVGTVMAVILAISLPKFYLKLYIGILIFLMGLTILLTINRNFHFSWKKITSLGLIAAFNKGISGGGYGPIVTGGQLLTGINGKNAVGITSFAEGLTCLVGVTVYIAVKSKIEWVLAPYLLIGAVISVPLSAYTVKFLKTDKLRLIIGLFTIVLGLITLFKLFF